MIFFHLARTFFKIGLFSFGGGYAMIPLMMEEVQRNRWLTLEEFADLIAISQMTPGPIGINAATFIGLRAAGSFGAVSATFGVVLPSFIIIVVIARLLEAFRSNRTVDAVIRGIRPATIGLIATAVLFFAELSIFRRRTGLSGFGLRLFSGEMLDLQFAIHPWGLGIAILAIVLSIKFRFHPIAVVLISGLAGVFLMG